MANKQNIVHCRVCGREICKTTTREGIDWIMPSRNYYFHKNCYDNWRNSSSGDDQFWVDRMYDLLARDLKMSYDWWICEGQRKKFLKKNMTNKGIYYTLLWFYTVNNGDRSKAHGGIGIVEYVYNQACSYWVELEERHTDILSQIDEQLCARERENAQIVVRKAVARSSKKSTYDFSDVEMD